MKIAYLFYDRPDYFNGPMVNAYRLLPEWRRTGHEVHALIFHSEAAPMRDYFAAHGIACHTLDILNYTESKIVWLLERVREISPDVFLPNFSTAGLYAARWVRAAGIPTVGVHLNEDRYNSAIVEQFVVGSPEWAISGLACISEATRRQIEALNPQYTKLCANPVGTPLPALRPKATDMVKIAYSGRIIQKQKRILETIAALIEVCRRHSNVEVNLFGTGPEWSAVETAISRADMEGRIYLRGACVPAEVMEHLLDQHILVLLSDYEGTPGAIFDAMACGVVPVCTNSAGGVREMIRSGETGFVVDDREEVFQDRIARLISDPNLRQDMAQKARRYAEKHYSLERCAADWIHFLERLPVEGERCEVEVPRDLSLPAPHPDLVCDDRRRPRLSARIWRDVRKLLSRLVKRLLGEKAIGYIRHALKRQ